MTQTKDVLEHPSSCDWQNATGPVAVRMSNDYLFRALLQRNNKVLKALVSSLLYLDEDSISEIVITNPLELGKTVYAKDIVLDIRALMNDNTVINLEMQVINEANWPDRSLTYLCRAFDNLEIGDDYLDVKAAVHIGLLDFTLFPDAPEFYATYRLYNEKNQRLYSDKLRLSVLDLTQIHLATEEDCRHQIDYWATLFKATTWEEIKMLAKSDINISEAASTVYQLTQEESILQVCEAREEFYRRQRTTQRLMERTQESLERTQIDLERAQGDLERTQGDLERTQGDLERTQDDLERTQSDLEQKQAELQNAQTEIEQLQSSSQKKDEEIELLRQKLQEHGIDS